MAKNYTQIQYNNSEFKIREEEKIMENVPEISEPSDSVVMNLLNYSKALSVKSDKTGNVHLVLLN